MWFVWADLGLQCCGPAPSTVPSILPQDLHAQQEELRSLVQSIDERLERLEDRQTADDARKLRRSWSIL